ncbi:MAG: O-antigen ligase family protein [Sphingobacteriales bacterium]|nr:O-antigen ligase family protein [Sphingobacteriales bacterium]
MLAAVNKEKGLFLFFAALFLLTLAAAAGSEDYWIMGIPFTGLLLYAGWMNKSLVFYGLLFSLPLSVEYNFSSTLGTDFPDELLMLLTSGLFLLYSLYNRSVLPKEIKQHPLLFFLFILLGWMIVTVLFSTNPLVSVKYGLAKSWYLGAFVLAPLIVFTNRKAIQTGGKVLGYTMLLVTLIALIRHSSTGYRFAGINEAVSPFFRNHVNYSAMLVCVIPVWIAFYKLERRPGRKKWILLILLISAAALFFSYARGAWLALLTGLLAYGLIYKKWLVPAFLVFLFTALAAVSWLKNNDRYLRFAHQYQTTVFHKDFGEHLVATYKLKDVSTAERFYRWIAGIRMTGDKPLTGFGPNTFYENYKPYGIPAFKTWVSDNKEHSTVHNYFLLTLIEQGYPGLFFFLLLLGAMLYYAQFLYHRIRDPFYRMLALTTGVILVMIITVNCLSDLVETDKVGSLFFLCLALLIRTDYNTRQEKIIA